MEVSKYPLPNNEMHESKVPKEILEQYILTKRDIGVSRLKTIEQDDKWQGYAILLNQYHLVQSCYQIDTPFLFEVVRCDYKYENTDNQIVIGNYLVPHFYLDSYNSKYDNSHNIDEIDVNDGVNDLCILLEQLPIKKENIHIGFLGNGETDKEIISSKYDTIRAALSTRGYYYDNQIIDDFGYFSWDDSIYNTVTVFIDLINDEDMVNENIFRFLRMDYYPYKHWEDIGGKLIYISFVHLKRYDKGITSVYNCLPEWMEIEKPPYYLFPMWFYYPTSSNVIVDDKDWRIRRLIWNFKGDSSKVSENEHQVALEETIEKVIRSIGCTFGFDLKQNIVFCCVPSSSFESYKFRYEEFTKQVCQRLNMINGYDIIHYTSNSTPKHLGGEGRPKYDIKHSKISNKDVIIFDDIYTTGYNMRLLSAKLSNAGARVIGGIVLGMTETDTYYEDYLKYKGYYDRNNENLW